MKKTNFLFGFLLVLSAMIACLVSCEKETVEVTAFAGKDTIVYDTLVIHLYAKTPESGTGKWTILSGSGGNLSNPYDPNSKFSGHYDETYLLSWEVYANSSKTNDNISITFLESAKPPVANAGNDKTVYDSLVVQLQGNLPPGATGTWSLLSPLPGTITNEKDPNTLFYAESYDTYVFQWKLVNEEGADSATVSITFEETGPPPFTCGDDFVDDRDGQSYATVEINGVCWFAENLNHGEMTLAATTQSDNEIIEKYCYSDQESNCDTHGGLYQWNEMMDYTTVVGTQGICPAGWRISTDEDWIDAEMALGMSESDALLNNTWRGTDQGTKMKEGGSSGLEIKMSGRYTSGFGYKDTYTYFWTSNEAGNEAYRRCLSSSASDIGRYTSFGKYAAFSVRCVKE